MKGTTVSTWLKTCRRLYNDEVVDKAMNTVGWDGKKIFTPIENVEDGQIFKVIKFVADHHNIAVENLWRQIGKHNIKSFFNDFPAFFEHENLYSFLKSLYDIHVVMTKKFPGAKPPLVTIKPINNRQAIFTYQSSRGMFDYFLGLLEGAADFYKEKLETETLEKQKDKLVLKLTFSEGIYYKKRYRFSKLLSFGFIKSIPIKAGLTIAIIMLIVSLILDIGTIPTVITTLISLLSVTTITKLLLMPLKSIEDGLDKINDRIFFEDSSIETNDTLEEFYDKINDYKKNIMADFTGFKGVTDEMNTFAEALSIISNKMDNTSDDITSIVEQVADGAVNQAENTEKAVYILNDNIQALNKLVESENENKKELELALEKINDSHDNIKNASGNILETLEDFKEVKRQGNELESKARDIHDIVSIVSQISDQTNLLALNASIEAARAGIHGRGFVVVAEEVRGLSDQTKKAVEEINAKLNEFSSNINQLVNSIDNRYDILAEETKSLENVRDKNHEATLSIRDVSSSMIHTVTELEKEAGSLTSIYETIEALAAIAEENSASSQEVSANVTSYAAEIKKLINHVNQFKEITEAFKNDLSKYKI